PLSSSPGESPTPAAHTENAAVENTKASANPVFACPSDLFMIQLLSRLRVDTWRCLGFQAKHRRSMNWTRGIGRYVRFSQQHQAPIGGYACRISESRVVIYSKVFNQYLPDTYH